MLAGRRDVEPLTRFVSDFATRFAENDGTIHDAYGWRWRHMLGFDQLSAVVRQLTEKPESRQAVIQMWDAYSPVSVPTADKPDWNKTEGWFWHGEDDLQGNWRTRPCNTHAYLRIREEKVQTADNRMAMLPLLDITVCCRSNDIVMGAYGANAVHFSILQEYLAAMLDVGVGHYYQFSNNYHVYQSTLDMLDRRDDAQLFVADQRYGDLALLSWPAQPVQPTPLVHEPGLFDAELQFMLQNYDGIWAGRFEARSPDAWDPATLSNRFLSMTVWPMLMAHYWHKKKVPKLCDEWLVLIEASDWRAAATEWVFRRRK